MAAETQNAPDAKGRDAGAGAAASAPTAPHATEAPTHGTRATLTGPERFWSPPWRRVVGVLCVLSSLVIHYELAPWSLLPEHEFEIRDTVGDLSIPIDVLQGDDSPAPPPPPPPVGTQEPRPAPTPVKGEGVDAGKALRPDAGAERLLPDAQAPKPRRPDAGHLDASPSDGAVHEAGSGRHEDAAVARAGQVSGVARDAVGMIGAAGSAQAGPQRVVVTINMAAIRSHPVGSRIGPFFAAIPQWDDFLVGTGIEPLRDTDWVSINGPSLIHSEKDVILVHYSASDAVVDRALEAISHKSGNGGPFDDGVPGVKAVFMRPQPHVVAVVPPFYASKAAPMLAKSSIPRVLKRPTEALRLTLLHPHGPMPAIPESVTELRLWIVPKNSDGSADIFGEGDTATPDACREAVDILKAVVRDQNSFGARLLLHGLLDGVELRPDGPTVRLHVPVSRDQLEVILAFAAGRLGVTLPQPDGGVSGAGGPVPRPPLPH